tara:strand:- start:2295 stop:3749 length:1455 start_codon:yes stop_codon:yes gene_type:complete
MVNSYNLGGLSRMNVDPTLGGLVDGVDFPHSGILKSLNVGTQGNYAIINGAIDGGSNNFDIVQSASGSNTVFTVALGKVMRDGKVMPVASLAFTQGTPSTFDVPASGNAYYLLVATDASPNILAMRDNGNKDTVDIVPQLTVGDIPIAVIKLEAGGTVAQRQIQFLTTAKDENSLSIGYNATGYTETATIQGASGVTTITAASATDVKVKLAGTAAGDTFEVLDSASQTQFKVQGDGAVSNEGVMIVGTDLTVTGGDIFYGNAGNASLKVTDTAAGTAGKDLTISAGTALTAGSNNTDGGDLILNAGAGDGTGTSVMTFSTKVSGTDAAEERMRISNLGYIGIGTDVPADALAVNGTVSMAGINRKFVEVTSGTTPPTAAHNLSITSDHTLWATTVAFNPSGPSGGPMPIVVPAASTANVGHEYQLIIKANAGGADNLTIAMTGSDVLLNEVGATVSTPMTTVAGKIYKLLCVSGTQWMLQTLN